MLWCHAIKWARLKEMNLNIKSSSDEIKVLAVDKGLDSLMMIMFYLYIDSSCYRRFVIDQCLMFLSLSFDIYIGGIWVIYGFARVVNVDCVSCLFVLRVVWVVTVCDIICSDESLNNVGLQKYSSEQSVPMICPSCREVSWVTIDTL